ncbi:amino acid/polyamine/organocation transporter (APC superfamily) [Bacillus oleivorans]|uniref:Amino acid/polyamine/organocation transporter (APC superfamily) n=1 Tax=Bacillus oleivorans TaxID=1448271 RepID=A0A285CPJ2_9BACI|nr:amino acid permease [Bacillus oleivorans]SNX69472.1 amino acid/polyamine/organocation transporter (APC superfamily) [Bacillus oleivorans]
MDNNQGFEYSYKQELKRTLKLFSSFAVAFSFISITTGIFTNYGFVLDTAGPAGIWAWPIVVVGHFIVAVIFAELAGRIPLSGYSYQWISRIANPGVGWISGWIAICFLIIVVPTVDYGLAPIFAEMIGLEPTKTVLLFIVIGTLVIQAIINIFGVKLATRINDTAVYTEVIGMVGIIVVLGIVVGIFGNADWSLVFSAGEATSGGGSYLGAFLMAALMGSYTLVGFEAAANLSEETLDASKNVPKAIMLSVALSGIIGTIFLVVVTASIPELGAVMDSANPIPYILQSTLGPVFSGIFLVLVIISIFACGLIIMASASRMIFAMARDDVFFGAKAFKKVNPKTSVPVNAVIFVLIFGIIAVLFLDSLTLLVGATAVLPALLYLLTVVSYTFKKKDLPDTGSFDLGKWRKPLQIFAILWLIFEIGILTVPSEFHSVAIVASILLAVGIIIYFTVFKKRIDSGEIGINKYTTSLEDLEKAE